MTTTAPAVESPTAATVAEILSALLEVAAGWGLPEPCYVSFLSGTRFCPIGLQFEGPDPLATLHAWADRFGVPVATPEPGDRFARVYFTFSGTGFQCYARIAPDE